MTVEHSTTAEVLSRGNEATPQQERASRARRWLGLLLVLVAVSAGLYAQTLRFDFVDWDDPLNVAKNPLLKPPTLGKVLYFWRRPFGGLYIPVTYSFFALEAWIDHTLPGGNVERLRPWVFHAGNVTLHVLCVLLVLAVLRQVIRRDVPAAMGAALFSVHPLHVESVAWVTETKGLLAGAFSLLAIWLYLLARPDGGPAEGQRPRRRRGWRWRRWMAASVALVLALLSKPSAVSVPLMLVGIELFWFRAAWRQWLGPLVVWGALAGAAVWWTASEQRAPDWGIGQGVAQRAFVAADAAGFYLSKLAVPWPLGPDYGRTPQVAWHSGSGLAWLAVCVFAVLMGRSAWTAMRAAGKGPLIGATAGWLMLASLAPVLGLVPFGYQVFSTVADRYAYVALLGPAWLLAWCADRSRAKGRAGRPLRWGMLLAVAVWAALSWQQAGVWRNSTTLFAHALEVNPQSWMAHVGLGNQRFAEKQWDAAQRHYLAALEINPANPEAHCMMARVLEAQGQREAAIGQVEAALAIAPGYVKARMMLGDLLIAAGRPGEAAEQYRQMLEVPLYADRAHRGLGNAMLLSGRYREAAQHYEAALAVRPDDVDIRNNLANVLVELGRLDAAVEQYRALLRLDPDNRRARRNLGAVLVLLGRHAEALPHLQFAAQIDGRSEPQAEGAVRHEGGQQGRTQRPGEEGRHAGAAGAGSGDPSLHMYLAQALAALGRGDEAIEQLRQALRLKPDWPEARQRLEKLVDEQRRATRRPAEADPPP